MDIVRDMTGWTGFTRASVFVGGRETVYRHTGRGRPVLILAGDHSTRCLAAVLGSVARVIVPERIEGDDSTSTASWICGLLDGLGLEGAAIVADERHGLAAMALVIADPFRVDRVALLVDGETLVAGVGIEDRLESTGQRVLLVGRPAGSAADGSTAGPVMSNRQEGWVGRVVNLLRPLDT